MKTTATVPPADTAVAGNQVRNENLAYLLTALAKRART